MSRVPSVREQVRLILLLRWQLFRNSLRTLRGRLNAVSRVLLWLMMAGLMFGGGVAMGVVAWQFAGRGQGAGLGGLFWVVLLFWQLYPLLSGAGGAQFDFSDLLRFPLRYASFFGLSLAYGLFDPAAVISIFWLICLSAGAGAARPALLPWLLLASLIFAVMNVALARAFATWTDRWLAQRRTREIFGLVFVLLILTVNFLLPRLVSDEQFAGAARWLGPLHAAARTLPPGLVGAALTGALAGEALRALAGLALVSVYAFGFLWLLHLRLAAQFRGENLSEARVVSVKPERAAAETEFRGLASLPWRSTAVAAIFEREARYTLRNWQVLLQLLLPAFLVLFFLTDKGPTGFLARHRAFAFPIALAYLFLMEMNWFFNNLGYDGTGVRFLLMAPVKFRQVMLGKNLCQVAATLLDIFLLWFCVRWTAGPPTWPVVGVSFLAAAYALLTSLAIGNVISLSFPNRMEFGNFRRRNGPPGMAMLAGFMTQGFLIASSIIVFIVGDLARRPAVVAWTFLALAALAFAGYAVSLSRMDAIAAKHRQGLMEELCQEKTGS